AVCYTWQEASSLPVGRKSLLLVRAAALALLGAALVEVVFTPEPWLGRSVGSLSVAAVVLLALFVILALRPRRDTAPRAVNTRPIGLLMAGFCAVISIWFCRELAPAGKEALVLELIYALAAWVLAYGWMADPNLLSLHEFYRARLTRAYLGASNESRASRT